MEISTTTEQAENKPDDYGECYWCAKELKKPVELWKGYQFCSYKCQSESNRYGHLGDKFSYISSGIVLGYRLAMAFVGFVWFIVAVAAFPLLLVFGTWYSLILHPIHLILKTNAPPLTAKWFVVGPVTITFEWIIVAPVTVFAILTVSRLYDLLRTAIVINEIGLCPKFPTYKGNNIWFRFKNRWDHFMFCDWKRSRRNDWQ